MALSRRSARPRYTLLLLVLASVTVITLGYRGGTSSWLSGARRLATDAFAPLQSVAASGFRPVGNFLEGAVRYGALQTDNARLRQQIGQLQAQSAQAQDYQRQVKALTALDHLPFAPGLARIAADVISNAPSNFQDTVELDKGASAGIAVGMPVVTGGGLMGRVVQASSNRSTILLVTDPSSNIGVRFGAKGQLALVSGQGSGTTLAVADVFPPTQLTKGELMTTSGGQGDLFPPGIPVGKVTNATLAPGASQEDVTLAPIVRPDQIQFVDVLVWPAPAASRP